MSVEIEKNVLSVLMRSPEHFQMVHNAGIREIDFSNDFNREVFRVMYEKGVLSLQGLLNIFPDRMDSLLDLQSMPCLESFMGEWIGCLKQDTARRIVNAEAAKIAAISKDPQSAFPATLKACIRAMGEQSARLEVENYRSIEQIVSNYIESKQTPPTKLEVIPYGFPFDSYIRHGRGEIFTLGAVPGGGKTTLVLNVLLNLLEAGMKPVLFCDEMPTRDLFDRIVANRADVQLSQVFKRSGDVERCREAEGYLLDCAKKRQFLIRGKSEYIHSIDGISAELQRFYNESGGIDWIAIDYLQTLKTPDFLLKKGDTRKSIDYNLEALKDIAGEFNAAILLLSQLSRSGQQNRPDLTSLKESSHIEEVSSIVAFLERDFSKADIPAEVSFSCMKNRNGELFRMSLYFDGRCARFTEHTYQKWDQTGKK